MESKEKAVEATERKDTTTIKVAGKEHTLRFGRYAIEEVILRTADNPSQSTFKIVCDIIYAGICDEMFRLDIRRVPKYEQVSELVEQLYDEPDASEQIDRVCNVFENSKNGKRLIADLKSSIEKLDESTVIE